MLFQDRRSLNNDDSLAIARHHGSLESRSAARIEERWAAPGQLRRQWLHLVGAIVGVTVAMSQSASSFGARKDSADARGSVRPTA